MSSDKQELIRRCMLAILQGYWANPNDDHHISEPQMWKHAADMADMEPPQPEPQPQPTDDRMRRALQLIAQLADTKSRAHKERFQPNGEGDGIANGWRVAEVMREIANDVVGHEQIESMQTVSPNAATRLTPDEFYAAVMACMPWIAERIPQHRRVIEAVRLCAKSPEQAACAIEVAWMDGGVEPQPPVDDRIERALQLMREAFRQRADTNGRREGWEMVSEAVQILEGENNG